MKTNNTIKTYGSIIREEEIKLYGKPLSLRPSISHKSKKKYSRKNKHHEEY